MARPLDCPWPLWLCVGATLLSTRARDRSWCRRSRINLPTKGSFRMKTRHFSFFSLATAYVLLTSASGIVGGGCGGSSAAAPADGRHGRHGRRIVVEPDDLISDFEDLAAATVVMSGTPPRNGYWYTYNDDNPQGNRRDLHPGAEVGAADSPGSARHVRWRGAADAPPATMGQASATGGLSLHAKWVGCSVWGAGIGADLGQPQVDGGTYTGPKVPYDISAFKGMTFLAMAVVGTDTALRIKFPMTDETKVEDGGAVRRVGHQQVQRRLGREVQPPQQRHLEADHGPVDGCDASPRKRGARCSLEPGARHVDPDPVRQDKTEPTTSTSTTCTSSSNRPIDLFARRVPWKRARRGLFPQDLLIKVLKEVSR